MTPEQTPPPAPRVEVAELSLRAPLCWLWHGLQDFRRQPLIGLFYGVCFWIMARVVATVFQSSPEYTLSAVSGSLLLGPFLAMGLYDVSLHLERGERPSFRSSLTCWRPHLRSMSLLVLIMLLLELLWGRASLVVFAVFFNTGMPTTSSVLDAVFNPENWEFVAAYICVGGFFAGLVFATMMVSIPMILDRDTDAITAGLTSLRVFFERTGVAVFWGALITVMVGAAMMPYALGLLLVGPWLGFASWHAYRGAVRA